MAASPFTWYHPHLSFKPNGLTTGYTMGEVSEQRNGSATKKYDNFCTTCHRTEIQHKAPNTWQETEIQNMGVNKF